MSRNVATNLKIECCERPAIAIMDYIKYTPRKRGPRNTEAPRVNRCCTNCWSHWFGPINHVKTFTRKQWDAMMDAVTF